MPDFEKLTPELSELFLRIDAAAPSDPVLRKAAELWQKSRGHRILPQAFILEELPAFIRPHAFLAQLNVNGGRHWEFSDAGSSAHVSLGTKAGRLAGIADMMLSRRLEVILDLVEQKGEPYAAMFEVQSGRGKRQLCEIYAAPLPPGANGGPRALGVLNSRTEAMR
jgi:hypothetical protein